MCDDDDDLASARKTIAELKARNARLEARNRLFEGAVAWMPVVFFRLDGEGVFTESMGAGLARLGLVDGQVVGTSALEGFPEAREYLERSLAGETTFFEVSGGTAGHPWHYLTYAAFDETSGAGVVAVSIDITERRESERQAQRMQEKLQQAQKLESLGLLAGGIAHDFNNLLMGVLGNASLVRMDLERGGQLDRTVGDIEIAAQRAAELCQQLLAYAGRGKFVVETLDLAEVVKDTATLLEHSVPRTVELTCQCASDVPAVCADMTQLRQVVMNLVINAAEAIGEGNQGQVIVRTGAAECDEAELADALLDHALTPGTHCFLEVADDGCGMDEETIGQVFDPFFTTKRTGRGLGMAAVVGIVRGHGGTIRIQSDPGIGTTVTVLLPATPDDMTHRADEQAGRPPPPRAGSRILVVDDEPTVCELATRILGREGYAVTSAPGGAEALHLFSELADDIDLVLLDLTMPGLSGDQVLEGLRKIRPDVRVILSSGYDEEDSTRRVAGGGLVAFLQKPYSAERLLGAVARALADRGE